VKGVSFDMVRVPPGLFVDGEGEAKRTLLVSRPFDLGVTLVTQVLWRAVTGKSPSRFQGDDLPVEQVSWDDVQVFLGQIEALGFRGFRLPTETERAWAARCGASTWWAGADRVEPVAVVDRRSTAPVGGLLPSVAGALDLSGNLLEWQQDWFFNPPAAGIDSEGLASGLNRVFRGGCWDVGPQDARVSSRGGYTPGGRLYILGVRLLRTVP
jgi:formylglycine-generating enzyme required for sulfatase activity